jgi:hypothetical protein
MFSWGFQGQSAVAPFSEQTSGTSKHHELQEDSDEETSDYTLEPAPPSPHGLSPDDPFGSWSLSVPLQPTDTNNLGRNSSSFPAAVRDQPPCELIAHEAFNNVELLAHVSDAVLGSYGQEDACLIAFTFQFQGQSMPAPHPKCTYKNHLFRCAIRRGVPPPPPQQSEDPKVEACYPNGKPVVDDIKQHNIEACTVRKVGTKVSVMPSKFMSTADRVFFHVLAQKNATVQEGPGIGLLANRSGSAVACSIWPRIRLGR